jgi:hypothetical protein
MVCPPKGFKVDLDNQPLTMTTRLLPTADAFAHKSAHYQFYPLIPVAGITLWYAHCMKMAWDKAVESKQVLNDKGVHSLASCLRNECTGYVDLPSLFIGYLFEQAQRVGVRRGVYDVLDIATNIQGIIKSYRGPRSSECRKCSMPW